MNSGDLGLLRRLPRFASAAVRPASAVGLYRHGFRAYPRAIREAFRDPTHRQAAAALAGGPGKPSLLRRSLSTTCNGAWPGSETLALWLAQRAGRRKLRRRSQGGPGRDRISRLHQRLNATFRERLATLTRRGRALARCTTTLHAGMYLIRHCLHNFCTYHTTLSPGRGRSPRPQTPAMAAALSPITAGAVQRTAVFPRPAAALDPSQTARAAFACAATLACRAMVRMTTVYWEDFR